MVGDHSGGSGAWSGMVGGEAGTPATTRFGDVHHSGAIISVLGPCLGPIRHASQELVQLELLLGGLLHCVVGG